jgi:hypothetical protein
VALGRILSQKRNRRAAPSLRSSSLVRTDFHRSFIYVHSTHTRARPLQSLLDNRIHAYSTKNCTVLGLGLSFGELQAELDYRDRYQALTGSSLWECPACHRGRMIVIGEIPPGSIPAITDTS